jgi:hypothetical protein
VAPGSGRRKNKSTSVKDALDEMALPLPQLQPLQPQLGIGGLQVPVGYARSMALEPSSSMFNTAYQALAAGGGLDAFAGLGLPAIPGLMGLGAAAVEQPAWSPAAMQQLAELTAAAAAGLRSLGGSTLAPVTPLLSQPQGFTDSAELALPGGGGSEADSGDAMQQLQQIKQQPESPDCEQAQAREQFQQAQRYQQAQQQQFKAHQLQQQMQQQMQQMHSQAHVYHPEEMQQAYSVLAATSAPHQPDEEQELEERQALLQEAEDLPHSMAAAAAAAAAAGIPVNAMWQAQWQQQQMQMQQPQQPAGMAHDMHGQAMASMLAAPGSSDWAKQMQQMQQAGGAAANSPHAQEALQMRGGSSSDWASYLCAIDPGYPQHYIPGSAYSMAAAAAAAYGSDGGR